MRELASICNKSNVLVLRYEDFLNNHDYIFTRFEEFFSLSIAPSLKEEFCEQFKVDKVHEKSQALGDFSQWDKNDQVHGKHVSKYKGQPGTAMRIFSREQLLRIQSELSFAYDAFGYEKLIKEEV